MRGKKKVSDPPHKRTYDIMKIVEGKKWKKILQFCRKKARNFKLILRDYKDTKDLYT